MTNQKEHPLQKTMVRAKQLNDYLNVQLGLPNDAGWVAPVELFDAPAELATRAAATRQRLKTQAPHMVASSLLQNYQWPILATGIAAYLLDRRVPDLGVENVLLRFDADDEAEAIALQVGRFTALPDDPAVDHPDASIVPDQDALLNVLRLEIEAHFGFVIERLGHHAGGKSRGLWLNVADRCAALLIWLSQEIDPGVHPDQIEQEIDALIRVPGSPLNNKKVGLFTLSYGQHTRAYLDRATCCYWYKTDDGDYCGTCPHRTPEDRNERMLTHLIKLVEGPSNN